MNRNPAQPDRGDADEPAWGPGRTWSEDGEVSSRPGPTPGPSTPGPPSDVPHADTLALDEAAQAQIQAGSPGRAQIDPRRLGHYQILAELGRGGMGVVYLAHDTRLERKVAIKQLRVEGSVKQQRRLIREALAMARLSHPNVAPIYEIGERGDSTFIVMEYVDGMTLRRWLATPPAQTEILAVFASAARGLIAAHQKGLVHRDFKPDNVMIDVDGRVRVMDFGLARAGTGPAEARAWAGLAEPPSRAAAAFEPLTQTGMMVGTPAYMPPELFRGEPSGPAGDQFSFCVALYEALYGQRPFDAEDFEVLRAAVLQGERRPIPPGAAVPAWLHELVCRGLAPWPEDRHPSMQALLDALVSGELEQAASGREPPAYVFVAHAGGDKPAVLRLCQGLLDHGVRPWLDLWNLDPEVEAAGEARGALLAALAEAPALILCCGPHGEAGERDRQLADALADRIERNPTTVHRVRLPGGSARPGGAGFEGVELAPDRWDAGLVELARLVGVDRARRGWLEREAAELGLAPAELTPYRGLEAFHERDARWMFGREGEIDELLELIRAERSRFITVIGASGSGKSSLLMAGLCPALRHGALGDGRSWTIAYLRPGPRPCEALAQALVSLQSPAPTEGAAARAAELREQLLAADDTLRRVVSRLRVARVLLVVDQLEELFTEARVHEGALRSPEAMAFVRNLRVASEPIACLGSSLWVAASLRADFVQRGLELGELASVLKEGTYFALPPMDEGQLRAAIERPARRVGFAVEARLVEKLVAAAAGQAGRLPLLQHLLRELWQRRDADERVLAHASYAETGGLEGAIAVAAERALDELRAELGERAETLARRLMTRLVHLGETSSADTRRRVSLAELGDDPKTHRVLEVFVEHARVLIAGEPEGPEEVEEVVEIAHEALLREWSTLVAWLAADRGALRLRQELAASAAEHQARGGREYLWGKGRADEARRVLAASVVELNEAEQTFLRASERAAEARERRVWGGVAAFMVAALAVVLVLLHKNGRIREQSEAIAGQSPALVHQKAAVERKNVELEERDRRQTDSLSVQRGLRAQMLIPEQREAEALLLAVQALGVYGPEWSGAPPQPEAAAALERVLAEDTFVIQHAQVLTGHEGAIEALAYAPAGARLATAGVDHSARIWDARSGEQLALLRGHEDEIEDLAWAPDGSQLATASKDASARLWDPETGEQLALLTGHAKPLVDLAWAPDGSRLATASLDWSARLWAPALGLAAGEAPGRPLARLTGHEGEIWALAWAPGGGQLATVSFDGTGRVWDGETGAVITELAGHQNYLWALAWSPDGARVATASFDGTVRLWEPTSGRLLATFEGHEDDVDALAFSPDGSRLASASQDGTVRLWDPTRERPAIILAGHTDDVVDLAWSPAGEWLASASWDQRAGLWDPESGELLAAFEGHAGQVLAVAWAPDGAHLATAGKDGTARIWTPELDERIATLEGHREKVRALAYSPDGARLATASVDGTVRVWEPGTGQRLALLEGHGHTVTDLAWSPDGARLATSSHDDSARIWDPVSGEQLALLEGHEAGLWTLAWSPDGSQLATAGKDTSVRIWDASSGAQLMILDGHEYPIYSLDWAPDGSRLATASFDRTARIWSLGGAGEGAGESLATLEGHGHSLWDVAWSPDGARVATAGFDGTARIWSGEGGELLATLAGHEADVVKLAWSPEGTRLATAGADKTARIWDPLSGEQLALLEGHEDGLWALAWSPQGRRLATAGYDATARIWDPQSGEQLATLAGHEGDVNAVVFSPDGRRVATASDDRSAREWDADTGALVVAFHDRIGLRGADGTVRWPIPPETLTRIGCQRLRLFASAYAEAAEICAPLLGE